MPSRRATSEAWVVVGPTIRGQDSHPIVREVRVDRVALAQGSPDAILVRDSELTPDVVEAWMNALRTIRIPIGGVEEHMGLDGTSYTLHVEAGMATASLRWWNDGPEAWSELTAWARSTMAELRARVG
jgi:hypothetical protein